MDARADGPAPDDPSDDARDRPGGEPPDRGIEPALGPGEEPDADAAFRAIVEGFSRSSDGPVPPWPVAEDVDSTAAGAAVEPPSAPRRRDDSEPPDADLPGWVEPARIEDESHYVPPPPPPPPRLRPRTLAAAAAVGLGIVLLFAPSLVDVAPGAGTSLLGMLLTGGGAGALVYWMRDAPGADEGPDDGAVV